MRRALLLLLTLLAVHSASAAPLLEQTRKVTVIDTNAITRIVTTNVVPHYSTYRASYCQWCLFSAVLCRDSLEVHHLIPKSTCLAMGLPLLVHDPRNLITLCDCPIHQCHLLVGHLGNYTRDNNELAEMVAARKRSQKRQEELSEKSDGDAGDGNND